MVLSRLLGMGEKEYKQYTVLSMVHESGSIKKNDEAIVIRVSP